MDNVCNRCLFSIPSKVEMAEEQEYLRCPKLFGAANAYNTISQNWITTANGF